MSSSPVNSPSVNIPVPNNNTTQNLNKLAKHGEDEKDPAMPSNHLSAFTGVVAPVAVQPGNNSQNNGGSSREDPPSSPSPVGELGSPSPLEELNERKQSMSKSADNRPFAGSRKDSRKDSREEAPKSSPEKKGGHSPLSLSVNGVDGDNVSFCLCAVRLEEGGVREKKTNFFFDVSVDEVDGDAAGLVDANKPDFSLNVEEVATLLSRRISENIHKTNVGKRLRLNFAEPPKLERDSQSHISPQPKPQREMTTRSNSVLQLPHALTQSAPPNGGLGQQEGKELTKSTEGTVDIDTRRMQMLENFQSEKKISGNQVAGGE
jgi:hypothetical protein